MDFIPGIDSAYRSGRADFSSLPPSVARKEVSKEFLAVFLDEILKESFKTGAAGMSSSRLALMRKVVMDKLSEDMLASNTFSLNEVLPDGNY